MKPRITRMNTDIKKTAATSLYGRIREILESAKTTAARSVNTTQVVANWLVGREIVEEEQKGKARADYGESLIRNLSAQLQVDYGAGYSLANVKYFRKFYLEYPQLAGGIKVYAVRSLLPDHPASFAPAKGYALRDQLPAKKSWTPGQLHPNLSWTHYRTLLRVDKPEARSFYEIEAIQNNWSARAMERQICSLLYERLALSRDKKGLMRLATKGHEIQKPADVFKDPVVMEVLGLPESPKLVETDLEIRREVRLLRTPSASPRLRVRQSEVPP